MNKKTETKWTAGKMHVATCGWLAGEGENSGYLKVYTPFVENAWSDQHGSPIPEALANAERLAACWNKLSAHADLEAIEVCPKGTRELLLVLARSVCLNLQFDENCLCFSCWARRILSAAEKGAE